LIPARDDALDTAGRPRQLGKERATIPRRQIHAAGGASYRRGSEDERAFWRRTLEDGNGPDADLDHAIE